MLGTLIDSMMLSDSKLRPELPLILKGLEDIYLECAIEVDPSHADELTKAHHAGVQLRMDLDKLLIDHQLAVFENIDSITLLLKKTFDSLQFSSLMELNEFIGRTYVECWKQSPSLDDILTTTSEAINNYKLAHMTLNNYSEALKTLRQQSLKGALKLSTDSLVKIDRLSKQLEKGLARAKIYLNIDEIMLAQAKMEKHSLKCDELYSDLMSSIQQHQQKNDSNQNFIMTKGNKEEADDGCISEKGVSVYSNNGLFNGTNNLPEERKDGKNIPQFVAFKN